MLRTQLKGDAKLPDEQRPQCPLLHGGLELEDLGGNVPAAPLWPNRRICFFCLYSFRKPYIHFPAEAIHELKNKTVRISRWVGKTFFSFGQYTLLSHANLWFLVGKFRS